MNQILYNKKSKNIKNIFKIQLILSVTIAIFLIFIIIYENQKKEELEKISRVINKNMQLNSLYKNEDSKMTAENEIYFGKLQIEKINLEYIVFENYNEELLKISLCKFNDSKLGKIGNICIAGHNYNDERFFGRIDELEIKDKIKIEDLDNNVYEYFVYDIFEINDDDFESIKQKKKYELTLLTCNNSNNKRIIVKAYMKDSIEKNRN